MSEYNFSRPGVQPGDPLPTILLSQRDLGLRVPLNFVTNPGISLSAACFSKRIYEDGDFVSCLSNLLAVGFKRFEVDLYWNEARRVWSFCPVEVPIAVLSPRSSKEAADASFNLGSITSHTESITSPNQPESGSPDVNPRQLSGGEISSTATALSVPGTSLGTALPTTSPDPETPEAPIVNLGPFVCTSTINLSVFTSQILSFIADTQNTLGARLLYVVFNIHAASTSIVLGQPASQPLSLPRQDEMIGSLRSSNLSSYLFTPKQLFKDRLNLNDSWNSVDDAYKPLDGYFRTEINQNGILSTEDGWPSEAYIEFSQSKRLILGWGTIDPQMSAYNFSGDADTIFDSGYIATLQASVVASDEGQVTNGCFLRNGAVGLSQTNSSWSFVSSLPGFLYPSTPSSELTPLLSLTSNLTSCGISPHLNQTLLGSTASQNPLPYLLFTDASIWSWALDEPRNSTTAITRCASISSVTGRWSVTDCGLELHAACRVPNQPYNWTLTSHTTTYSSAFDACPSSYEFAVPRTALENAYLTRRIREENRRENVWLDFNALDADSCWVTGGVNATCPYSSVMEIQAMNRRTLLVALIAAIIVLVITALTIFVMCAGNRKVSQRNRHRKRRAAANGIFYEGVPS